MLPPVAPASSPSRAGLHSSVHCTTAWPAGTAAGSMAGTMYSSSASTPSAPTGAGASTLSACSSVSRSPRSVADSTSRSMCLWSKSSDTRPVDRKRWYLHIGTTTTSESEGAVSRRKKGCGNARWQELGGGRPPCTGKELLDIALASHRVLLRTAGLDPAIVHRELAVLLVPMEQRHNPSPASSTQVLWPSPTHRRQAGVGRLDAAGAAKPGLQSRHAAGHLHRATERPQQLAQLHVPHSPGQCGATVVRGSDANQRRDVRGRPPAHDRRPLAGQRRGVDVEVDAAKAPF